MSDIKDGGPAFPREDYQTANAALGQAGMTLRDYFAAKVLPVAMRDFYGDTRAEGQAWDGHDDVAEHCYLVADAMLKARAKVQP